MNPNSQFHLSFNIGYPNDFDRAHQRTGTAIMVHGNRVSIGCLAMTDEKIEEIYTLCDAAHHGGQPFFRVHIFPFRMTENGCKKPPVILTNLSGTTSRKATISSRRTTSHRKPRWSIDATGSNEEHAMSVNSGQVPGECA